ncbi:hypothetical protein NKR23_g7954 [Pleurostoma richardsiae]|uniref:BZIP domain-containing protein n=1 Tax=Pleurostoma richardsiae TaxID=41990 RepID=A0AA38RSF9_9PEZI|nr:hypothetical protein NKR23_g7954 [Pleurostoma richardsiae]
MDTPSKILPDFVDLDGNHPYQDTLHLGIADGELGGGPPAYASTSAINHMIVPEQSDPFVTPSTSYSQAAYPDMSLSSPAQDLAYFAPGLLGGSDTIVASRSNASHGSPYGTQSSSIRTLSSTSTGDRKSKSTSASSHPSLDAYAPEPEPKKRKGRRPKAATASTADEDDKRNKFLEKNRIAASKCRQKKKEYVNELEDTKNGLERTNAHLQLEYHGLLGEVAQMKNELMTHASCNDPNIDQWLENEARRFVQGKKNRVLSPQSSGAGSSFDHRSSTASNFALSSIDTAARSPRRGSVAFTNATSQASPSDGSLQTTISPEIKKELELNYNHMPDGIF